VENLGVVSRTAEGLSWDPAARVLRYPMYDLPDPHTWVSIIAEDGRLHDVGLSNMRGLPHLLASGPEVLARLEAEIPTPIGPITEPDEHVIFDRRTKQVLLWSAEPCVARPGWEGWSFERVCTDPEDHLARTGRRFDETGCVVAGAPGALRPVTYLPIEPVAPPY
jgi:hypothetical protein